MKALLVAAIAVVLLGACAHYGAGHADHHGNTSAGMPDCQGQGKEGEMCPLRNKTGSGNTTPECCQGKTPAAATGTN